MEGSHRFFSNDQNINEHLDNLPHWQEGAVWCLVTWCLADALPEALLNRWKEERECWLNPLDEATEKTNQIRFTKEIEGSLDQRNGSCILRELELAELVEIAIRRNEGGLHEVNCFVIMPNHVHVLFRPYHRADLVTLLKAWRRVSAGWINRYRNSDGEVWQSDYWGLLMQNERHFAAARNYILQDPVKAGLSEGEYLAG